MCNNYQLECKIWLDKVYFILCPQKFNSGLTHYEVGQDFCCCCKTVIRNLYNQNNSS